MTEEPDIVERLRNYNTCSDTDVDEAADEIERLRKELETLHQRIKDIKEGFEGCCNACEPVGEMNKQLRKERDEARQEICEAYCDSLGVLLGSPTTPRDYAWRRGWDCYKNENPHA